MASDAGRMEDRMSIGSDQLGMVEMKVLVLLADKVYLFFSKI